MGAAAHETRTGELLNQAYELHEVLESEGVCDIYRATDRKRARVVRIRLLRPEFALQSGVVQSFLHAPKTLTGLRHPNVSQVLAVESDDTGIPFVVEEHVEGESLARTSFTLVMLAIAGAMALALGVIGIYGVIAYVVAQRTREIGIRSALGAEPRELAKMFLRQGLALSAVGAVVGVVAAVALARLMSSLLFGVSPLDPTAYVAALVVIVSAAALATYLPARRAAQLDPIETLRAE